MQGLNRTEREYLNCQHVRYRRGDGFANATVCEKGNGHTGSHSFEEDQVDERDDE